MENITIVALVGFIGSLMAVIKPIINLNTSITKLNVTLDNTNKLVTIINSKVEDHEKRLIKLEKEG